MSRSARRSSITIIAFLAIGAVLGGLFGGRVQADARAPAPASGPLVERRHDSLRLAPWARKARG